MSKDPATSAEAIGLAMEILQLNAVGFARAIGVSQQMVSFMRSGARSVPPDKCPRIEQLTSGTVRRWHLRPADWWLIWPELIGREGAPKVPDDKTALQGG